jgi:DNA (cytosine-5)-methyltransferase 1
MSRLQKKQGLSVVSLFAGAGGLEIAACSTGKVAKIVSTDSNKTFLSTTEHNMPKHFPEVEHKHLVSDVRLLKGNDLLELIGGHADVVMGGPPCDDFTATGLRQGMNGNKGPLLYEFSRLVKEILPKVFLFENVPNLAHQFRGQFEIYLSSLKALGYNIYWRLLAASDYGSPTMRQRIIVVGVNSDIAGVDFLFPAITHGRANNGQELFPVTSELLPFTTVGDALQGLPDASRRDSDANSEFFNHVPRAHREKTIEHIKAVLPGVRTRKSFRYRPPLDGLCWSLTAGLDDSTKAYIHPTYHREMTVREYARIHSFPDTWKFFGTDGNGIKQVANSVPIPLGSAVWREIHKLVGLIHNKASKGCVK